MASRKASERDEEGFTPRENVPAQDEEADILEEVDAEEDEESGEMVADEEKVRRVGAADPKTVREGRRLRSVANKKRQGKKNVGFGTDDPLVVYETILKTWGQDSIDITFKRLSGQRTTQMISSHPVSRTELYEVFRRLHGESDAAEYEVRFHDAVGRQWRGQGRITMPDTRPKGQQSGNGHYPQQQPAAAPGAPSVVVHTPPGQDMGSMFSTFQAMFDMFQNMQQRMAPQQPYSPQMPIMPPQPPPTASPAEQMAWMQQVFDMFQRMQSGTPRSGSREPQNPQGPQLPNTPAPPGYKYTWLPESNCCVLEPINNRPLLERREPAFRGQRESTGQRPYYPQQSEQYDRYDPRHQQHQAPPDPLRESMSSLRRAVALRDELDSLLGGNDPRGGMGGHLDGGAAAEQDPNSSVEVVDTGNGKIIYGREDGNIRGWDTLLINLPEMFKKGGEYVDKISKTAVAERERQRREQSQRLPAGYVRMEEGDQPPHGWVAVPVDRVPQEPPPPSQSRQRPQRREDPLPPPPEYVPPPLQEEEPEEQEEEPPQQRGWEDL